MRKGFAEGSIVVKAIWWRQACFTLFLFVVSIFFAFVGYFGPIFSRSGTIIMALIASLSLFDQIFEWSRLRIDHQGFHLRGWFKNKSFAHHEVVDFQLVEFTGKKLLAVCLKEDALKKRQLPKQPVPFPCAFGRPAEDVLKILRSAIDRTPRPRANN